MDAGGVDLSLLSAWYGPEGALISDDEVAAFVAHAPDRLAGVASVDLRKPMVAVRELRRCVRESGFKALRVVPWPWGRPSDTPVRCGRRRRDARSRTWWSSTGRGCSIRGSGPMPCEPAGPAVRGR
ncbi:amidohydrolase family protein [Streptomyces sp. CA-210063]|uniref:amidohydrolase family protein n=1 Tax=Streptomyces sp. CA-210063 TaxID=2801029 RepID=UPI003FA6E2FD